jgi:hypothetical protein
VTVAVVQGGRSVNSRKLLGRALCAISVLLASSAVALGQNAPATDSVMTGTGEGSPRLFSETAVDQSPCAGGCVAGCCQPQLCPRWTASAEFICFERVGGVNQTLVSSYPPHDPLVPGTGVERLNANDLHQGFAGGPRLDLIRHGDGGYLEVSYFQIDGWSSVGDIAPNYLGPLGPPPNWLVFTAPGDFLQLTDYPDQHMAWTYTTRLYNAEVNVRRDLSPRATVLAGFRWVKLWEDLQGTMPTERVVPFWDTTTNNNLYGLQIGGEWKMLNRSRFSIDGLIKAGIFDNHADESATVSIYRALYAESASTNHTAFLGEVGLRCKYQVTERLLLKAGYEALWLEGVAVAPAQISRTMSHAVPVTDIYVQSLGVDSSSGAFFHGATVGLEYAF